MAEYIEREAALNASKLVYIECLKTDDVRHLEADCDYIPVVFKRDIRTLPAADVRPVVRGKWTREYTYGFEDGKQNYKLLCPFCNYSYLDNHCGAIVPEHFNYCPNCGADMREES